MGVDGTVAPGEPCLCGSPNCSGLLGSRVRRPELSKGTASQMTLVPSQVNGVALPAARTPSVAVPVADVSTRATDTSIRPKADPEDPSAAHVLTELSKRCESRQWTNGHLRNAVPSPVSMPRPVLQMPPGAINALEAQPRRRGWPKGRPRKPKPEPGEGTKPKRPRGRPRKPRPEGEVALSLSHPPKKRGWPKGRPRKIKKEPPSDMFDSPSSLTPPPPVSSHESDVYVLITDDSGDEASATPHCATAARTQPNVPVPTGSGADPNDCSDSSLSSAPSAPSSPEVSAIVLSGETPRCATIKEEVKEGLSNIGLGSKYVSAHERTAPECTGSHVTTPSTDHSDGSEVCIVDVSSDVEVLEHVDLGLTPRRPWRAPSVAPGDLTAPGPGGSLGANLDDPCDAGSDDATSSTLTPLTSHGPPTPEPFLVRAAPSSAGAAPVSEDHVSFSLLSKRLASTSRGSDSSSELSEVETPASLAGSMYAPSSQPATTDSDNVRSSALDWNVEPRKAPKISDSELLDVSLPPAPQRANFKRARPWSTRSRSSSLSSVSVSDSMSTVSSSDLEVSVGRTASQGKKQRQSAAPHGRGRGRGRGGRSRGSTTRHAEPVAVAPPATHAGRARRRGRGRGRGGAARMASPPHSRRDACVKTENANETIAFADALRPSESDDEDKTRVKDYFSDGSLTPDEYIMYAPPSLYPRRTAEEEAVDGGL